MGAEAVTLTDFLLERIAEERSRLDLGGGDSTPSASQRRLEREARRRIVEEARRVAIEAHGGMGPLSDLADFVLTHLAVPYFNHPDYRDEWKP